jgi:hypothetical protein
MSNQMKKPIKPIKRASQTEKKIATDMQAPTPTKPIPTEQHSIAMKPKNEFQSLLNSPTRDASSILGGESLLFVQLQDEQNPFFPTDADFSLPFFITKAWIYDSANARIKSRIAFRCVLMSNAVYGVALPYTLDPEGKPVYQDREAVLKAFSQSTQPIGLAQWRKIDKGQGTPYYALIYADEHTMELAGVNVDKDIPF